MNLIVQILLAAAQLSGMKVSEKDIEREVRKIAARDVRRELRRQQKRLRELHDDDFPFDDDDDEEE